MDGQRFEDMVKALAAARSRRQALKVLGSGLFGGVAALLGQGVAEATHSRAHCKEAGRPCAFNTNCCSQNCCNKVCCGPGETCQNGECVAVVCAGFCSPYTPCLQPGCVCNPFTGQCVAGP